MSSRIHVRQIQGVITDEFPTAPMNCRFSVNWIIRNKHMRNSILLFPVEIFLDVLALVICVTDSVYKFKTFFYNQYEYDSTFKI